MADVELLPLPECAEIVGGVIVAMPISGLNKHIRANVEEALAAKQAEHEREIEALRAEVVRLRRLVQELDTMLGKRLCAGTNADGKPRCLALAEEHARAERLAEALQMAAGELASIGDAIGHDHPEARRLFTLRASLISARLAALDQEDRNG